MTLYSYVVARDYGFAPNPFFRVCTLATCKSKIRAAAEFGDWIVGTGSKRYGLAGRLVYLMRVDEILTYTEYWHDPRFQIKKPNFRSSIRNAFGDNIYHKDAKTVKWVQENSHHSNPDGTPNPLNIEHDTASPRVLIGREFVYWGGQPVEIPARFKKVCAGRGHKSRFSPDFIESFIAWVESL